MEQAPGNAPMRFHLDSRRAVGRRQQACSHSSTRQAEAGEVGVATELGPRKDLQRGTNPVVVLMTTAQLPFDSDAGCAFEEPLLCRGRSSYERSLSLGDCMFGSIVPL